MIRNICIHWTGGGPKSNRFERQFYHDLIEQDGTLVLGLHKPEANCRSLTGVDSSTYAAHCGGGNSYTLGLTLCGMGDFHSVSRPGKVGLTREQCEAAWKRVAERAKQYQIPIVTERIYTHYLFGRRHPQTSSRGKIDIIHLPFEPNLKAHEIDPYILGKVDWYRRRL